MKNKGHKNLIPTNLRSKEEVRMNSQKGGINSGKARRRNKAIKNMIEVMVTSLLGDKNAEKIAAAYNIDAASVTKESAMIHRMIQKALKGDVPAFNSVMDRVHGKPIQEIVQNVEISEKPTSKSLDEVDALLENVAKNKIKES